MLATVDIINWGAHGAEFFVKADSSRSAIKPSTSIEMTDTTTPDPDVIVAAALDLCAKSGWRTLRMSEIAASARISEENLRAVFRNKTAILGHFHDRLEQQSLALAKDMTEETVHDRLFAMMMERLALAAPHRDAIQKMLHEGLPKHVLCRNKHWLNKLLKSAGATQGAGLGHLQTLALGAIWTMVMPVWFKDDSHDLAQTMAMLDGQLGLAENLWQTLQSLAPKF